MAKKEFILQGFTARTHTDALRELFDVPDIQRVLLSVAFVTESGVQRIEAKLQAHAAQAIVFAGIRNDITSHQGLARLHGLGVKLYAVDTGSRFVIFHPKAYLVRGKKRARLLIGSANLTVGGLNNNIEAGVLLDLDLTDATDLSVVQEFEARFTAVPNDYPLHVLEVSSVTDLDAMRDSGRLVDEMALPPPRPSTAGAGFGGSDAVPRIKLKVPPLRRPLVKAKPGGTSVAKRARTAKTAMPAPTPGPAPVGIAFEPVWESAPLTRRDLTIPQTSRTHATGSMNLDKGLLPDDVDHRHYFRDDVFSSLSWAPANRSGTVEEAHARFKLVLKGISYGEFELRIGHTTSTTSPAYRQRNAMTRLSWGRMRQYIARTDLIGRTLALYRDKADPTRFVLEID